MAMDIRIAVWEEVDMAVDSSIDIGSYCGCPHVQGLQ